MGLLLVLSVTFCRACYTQVKVNQSTQQPSNGPVLRINAVIKGL